MNWQPLNSRKVKTALIAAGTSLVIAVGNKLLHVDLDPSIVATLVGAVVALAVANITGIAIEDHGTKSNQGTDAAKSEGDSE